METGAFPLACSMIDLSKMALDGATAKAVTSPGSMSFQGSLTASIEDTGWNLLGKVDIFNLIK